MVDVSEYKMGGNPPSVRISGRVLTKREYLSLSSDQLVLLLGEKEGDYLDKLKAQMEDIFNPPKKAPNPLKKESIKDIDKQIGILQKRKKELQGVK